MSGAVRELADHSALGLGLMRRETRDVPASVAPGRRYRLVRNLPIEKWILGHPEPYAPRYDVEEIDDWRMPVRLLAIGVGAEAARAILARVAGIEQPGA